jgi:hypothetical protein
MEGKKRVLESLIQMMRQKMANGEGDEPLDVGDAANEAAGEAGAEHKEELGEILGKEEAELASGQDLDDDGKAGDPELVAAIKKYMGSKGGSPMPMKAGGMLGMKPVATSVSISIGKKGNKR